MGGVLRTRKTAPLQIKLAPRERARWHAAARALDMSLAELVREVVRQRVAQIVYAGAVGDPAGRGPS